VSNHGASNSIVPKERRCGFGLMYLKREVYILGDDQTYEHRDIFKIERPKISSAALLLDRLRIDRNT
jgi:hypothetical protein